VTLDDLARTTAHDATTNWPGPLRGGIRRDDLAAFFEVFFALPRAGDAALFDARLPGLRPLFLAGFLAAAFAVPGFA